MPRNDVAKNIKPRNSKVSIAAFILGMLSIFLFPLTYLPTVILSIIAFVKIKRSKGQLKGRWLAISGIIIPILISIPVLVVWIQDAGPVPNDFTEADLLHVKPENESSYEVLLQLCNQRHGTEEVSAIGLTRDDEDFLSDTYLEILDEDVSFEEVYYRVSVRRLDIDILWEKAKRGREVIRKLSEYSEVAELLKFEEHWGQFVKNLVDLNKLSCLYVICAIQSEDSEMAIESFLQLDRVVRSLSVFSQGLVTKMACLLSIDNNLRTANFLVNDASSSEEIINKIVTQFRPLSHEHVSLKNHIVADYLLLKSLESTLLSESNAVDRLAYKVNSTNRYRYSFCKNAILKDEGKDISEYCELSVWPWEKNWPKLYFTGGKARDQFSKGSFYCWYNPVGCLVMTFGNESLLSDEVVHKKTRILIRDDLLQWVLARRMGEEGSLKARAYSDEYTVDVENGLVFSVGPDGQAYTDDDIKLRIDPAVLGLE
ncbi:MAG: DUF4190 domain-containing protein [Planctomycetota bacterium]|jgi:hypothetical protein